MEDFAQRSKLYQARSEALGKAQEGLRLITGIHGIFTFLTVIAGLVVLWIPDRWGIGILVTLFLIRWVGNVIIRLKYVDPEMARIEKENPAPRPRPVV